MSIITLRHMGRHYPRGSENAITCSVIKRWAKTPWTLGREPGLEETLKTFNTNSPKGGGIDVYILPLQGITMNNWIIYYNIAGQQFDKVLQQIRRRRGAKAESSGCVS